MAAVEPVWAQFREAGDSEAGVHLGSMGSMGPWLRAARFGPADPVISRASKQCFEAADGALSRSGAPAPIRQAVADFIERYVRQDRCPADDQLEEIT